MGFWDFVADDFPTFLSKLGGWVPKAASLGGKVLSADELLSLGYSSPASPAGCCCRIAYEYSQSQSGSQQDAWNAQQNLLDNLQRGGSITPGPAAAGLDMTRGLSMAQIVIANTYRTTVKAVFGGQEIQNTFHFLGSGPGQETACCTALQVAWKIASGPLSRFDAKYTLVEFEAIDLSSVNGGIWVITDTTSGTRVSTATAGRQTSALITYNGQTRNRSSRGRTYLGPLYESDIAIDGASLEAASVTAIGTAMTNFRTSMNTAGFPMQVLSRTQVQNYPVTLQRVEPIIATQRRRLR